MANLDQGRSERDGMYHRRLTKKSFVDWVQAHEQDQYLGYVWEEECCPFANFLKEQYSHEVDCWKIVRPLNPRTVRVYNNNWIRITDNGNYHTKGDRWYDMPLWAKDFQSKCKAITAVIGGCISREKALKILLNNEETPTNN